MPELPEVETVIRYLKQEILNETITNFRPLYLPIIENDQKFIKKIKGQKINDIKRIGKYLIFILDNNIMVGHLRMEGKFYLKNKNDEVDKHEHLIFELSSGRELRYHDTRKFGRFHLEPLIDDLSLLHSLRNTGPDALLITEDEFYHKMIKTNNNIKGFLLNQKVLAGVGNIYANEILFLSKIHPYTRTIQINRKLSDLILKHTKEVLHQAIKAGGTTISSFESSEGIHGLFQNQLYVHGRKDLECLICNTKIEKIKVSGRGTYFCPNCQKRTVTSITGGIATGKTTVVKYLEKLRFDVIDSDVIVGEAYSDPQIIIKIKRLFEIDKIDKQEIQNQIIKNPNLKKLLEDIIHPFVFRRIDELKLTNESNPIFIDIPLLFETGYDRKVDEIIVVSTDQQTQIKRLMKRNNINKDKALELIGLQYPLTDKIKKADTILKNNDTLSDLYHQVDLYLRKEG